MSTSATLPVLFVQGLRDSCIDPAGLLAQGATMVSSRISEGQNAAFNSVREELHRRQPEVAYLFGCILRWEGYGHPNNNSWILHVIGDAYALRTTRCGFVELPSHE